MSPLKLCKHYKPDIEIEPISSWNAYIRSSVSRPVFRPGGFIEYLIHLRDNEECRKEVGITLEWVNLHIESFDMEIDRKLQDP
jgi:hypothetical protein